MKLIDFVPDLTLYEIKVEIGTYLAKNIDFFDIFYKMQHFEFDAMKR